MKSKNPRMKFADEFGSCYGGSDLFCELNGIDANKLMELLENKKFSHCFRFVGGFTDKKEFLDLIKLESKNWDKKMETCDIAEDSDQQEEFEEVVSQEKLQKMWRKK